MLVTLANNQLAKPDGVADAWLDGDTYGLPSVAERLRAIGTLTASDLQRAATRLVHDRAFASVVLGNSEVLKAQIERYGKVEVMGEIAPKVEPQRAPKTESNAKPPITSPAKP